MNDSIQASLAHLLGAEAFTCQGARPSSRWNGRAFPGPYMKKEMKNLQIIMIMHDSKLEEIQQQLKKLTPAMRDTEAAPENVEH